MYSHSFISVNNDEARTSKHEGIQNDAMTSAVRAWLFIRHADFVIKGARFLISLASLPDYASTNQIASRT
jgi:hypothetical protein